MKDKQNIFIMGFLAGLVFTVFFWRAFESVYIREILIGEGSYVSESQMQQTAPSRLNKTQPAEIKPAPLEPSDSHSWTQGPENAPVTLLEFSDFYCSFCSRAAQTIDQLMAAYPGKIKRVWKHFPLPMHVGAELVHEASECAGEQGKFWEFHDEVFSHQSEIRSTMSADKIAAKLGLDTAAFSKCTESRTFKSKVEHDIAEGQKAGVQGTPYFLINGKALSGAYPLETFKTHVEHALDPELHPLPSEPTPSKPEAPKGPVVFNDLKGRPSQGSSKAPITLVEFSDFHCPFCSRVTPTMDQMMKDYHGKVRRVWRHFPLPMHQGAHETHEASECANEQGKFWEYHEQLFSHQSELKESGKLEALAKAAGLNLKKFNKCVKSKRTSKIVDGDIKKGSEAGVSGTPAAFINGYLVSGAASAETFKAWIDHFLNPEKFPMPQTGRPSAPPQDAKPVQFTDLNGKPSLGPDNAKVTLVEFSDFHCPFCSRVVPTIDQLMKRFDGKIRRVWRHFPLPMHQGADRTHQASECAREQGKFWEFHGQAFEKQAQLSNPQTVQEIAKNLKIDEARFNACLESGKYKVLIQQEVAKGNEFGVRGTPAFFVNGKPLMGARPYEHFEQAVSEELKKS